MDKLKQEIERTSKMHIFETKNFQNQCIIYDSEEDLLSVLRGLPISAR
jgi:hypothetical protein